MSFRLADVGLSNVSLLSSYIKVLNSFKTSRSGEPNLLKTSSWHECKIPGPRGQTVDLFYIIIAISRRSSYPGSKVLMEVVTFNWSTDCLRMSQVLSACFSTWVKDLQPMGYTLQGTSNELGPE